MQILIHTVRMARILHIEQKIENFRAFESAIERDRSVEKAHNLNCGSPRQCIYLKKQQQKKKKKK